MDLYYLEISTGCEKLRPLRKRYFFKVYRWSSRTNTALKRKEPKQNNHH